MTVKKTGPLILDLNNTVLQSDEITLLQHEFVGGVILFARNYHSSQQLRELVGAIKSIRSDLLITVDQEGGRVQRFKDEFTRLPAPQQLGDLYLQKGDEALEFIRQCGWLMAVELISHGIDLSFAPVLDLDRDRSKVIGDRSFSELPDVCINVATAYCEGMRNAGMAVTAKHFPGHGSVEADSHVESPQDPRTFEQILSYDLVPFAKLIEKGLIDAVMPSHVIYTAVDDVPAVFSKVWIQEHLRKDLAFSGTVFSDDLSMEGAGVMGDIVQRLQLAIDAGCTKVLVCNDRQAVAQVLQAVDDGQLNIGELTPIDVSNLYAQAAIEFEALLKDEKYCDTVAQVKKFL